MGLPIVDELGERLEAIWRAENYDSSAFPDIAAAELDKARLHDKVAPEEIIGWVLRGHIPQQADPVARFGQPPVTLFRSRKFYVSALFWVDGTTTIHDHGFSGAFQVLAGGSIETRFTFQSVRDVDGHLQFGDLSVNGAALLKPGDLRPVPAGPAYIHSLFHLQRPSVSLVVRTYGDARPRVQFNYSPGGTAFDAFVTDETLERILQVVDLLRRTEDPSFEARVGELIEAADLYAAFRIVMTCAKLKDRSLLQRLVLRVRDEAAATRFGAWISKTERIAFIQQRRADVHDPDLRFLLAILLNLHRRADAMSLVSSYAPGCEPAKQIASWLRQLSEITVRLQVGTTQWEPSLFGLPAFDQQLEGTLADILAGRERPLSVDESAFMTRLGSLPALAPLFVD